MGNFEAQGVAELAREPALVLRQDSSTTTRDERSSSIEIQTKSRIEIKRSATGLILPADYLNLDDVVDSIVKWDFMEDAVHTYEVNSYHSAESLLGKLYEIIENIYKETGVIGG